MAPLAVLLLVGTQPPPALAQPTMMALQPCRLPGFEHEASCGRVPRPLDPEAPQGRQIEIHFAVLPALARNKHPDPVFVFAGGPGQSAIDLAGTWSRLLARVSNRRDIVLVDQRGTGRSAKLACAEPPPTAPLATALPAEAQARRLATCREALQRLPQGDLRHFTTWVAMRDVEAVRQALGAPRVNLVGGSYGTRAALEYQRQFPQAVRRLVIDGVAPPDMVLPAAFSTDNQAALERVFAACEADAATCGATYPALRGDWQGLLSTLPKEVAAAHPVTGEVERLALTREMLLGLARAPLYAPALAAGLPQAIGAAARGRFEPLFGLASALQGPRGATLAEGMHFSVVCAEDVPRLAAAGDGGVTRADGAGGSGAAQSRAGNRSDGATAASPAGADFGSIFADQYQRFCADWPAGAVPAAFYGVPPAPAAALVLSGGADPVTPPRHGERVTQALGAKARHVVVAEAGHGVMALPCMRDVLFRFIDAPDDAAALQVKADCASALPRPGVFIPPRSGAGGRP